MEASHKKHRSHMKVGNYAEEEEEEEVYSMQYFISDTTSVHSTLLCHCINTKYKFPAQSSAHNIIYNNHANWTTITRNMNSTVYEMQHAHFLTQAAPGEVLFKTANCLEETDTEQLR